MEIHLTPSNWSYDDENPMTVRGSFNRIKSSCQHSESGGETTVWLFVFPSMCFLLLISTVERVWKQRWRTGDSENPKVMVAI